MEQLHETQPPVLQRVILAAVDLGEYDIETSLDELEELAKTAGAEVVGRVCQKRTAFDGATCIGKGRLEELHQMAIDYEVDLIIFDHELTASQLRNIEAVCNTDIIDRTMLILDIFAARATSGEGRLQVELAQQKYRMPRLAGLGKALSRLGGGIGTRGPGETKLETDRRHIRTRITALEAELDRLRARRLRARERRRKDGVTTVAIVGYTNVGKSTLLNHLTQAGVLAEDKLFATLDPTARALTLPDGQNVMLIDTVGLVRRLPHHLVEAFASTLEHAAESDVLLNMCDITAPDASAQLEVTTELLTSLGAGDKPMVTVLNKCDRLNAAPDVMGKLTVAISAKTGAGIPQLLQAIVDVLPPALRHVRLLLPYAQGGLENSIGRRGKILSREFSPQGIVLEALVDLRDIHRVEEFITV